MGSKPHPKKRTGTARPHHANHHAKPKVFDVMRPGKAPASPTSRPVIVGHKQAAQKSQAAVSGIGESSPTVTAPKIEIKPLHSPDLAQHTEPAAPVAVTPAAVPAPDPEDLPAGAPPVSAASAAAVPEATDSRPALAITVSDESEAPVAEPPPVVASAAVSGPPVVPEDGQPPAPSLGDLQKRSEAEEAPAPKPEPTPATVSREGVTIQPPAPEAGVPAANDPAPEAEVRPSEVSPETSVPTQAAAEASANQKDKPTLSAPEEPFEIRDIVVSHHGPSTSWLAILLLMLVLLLAVAAGDILLDAEVVDFPNIPRTDYL